MAKTEEFSQFLASMMEAPMGRQTTAISVPALADLVTELFAAPGTTTVTLQDLLIGFFWSLIWLEGLTHPTHAEHSDDNN